MRPITTTLERPLAARMIRDIITRSAELRSRTVRGRGARLVVVFAGVGAFVAAWAYHLILWTQQQPPDPIVSVSYRIMILIGALCLWTLLNWLFEKREPNPARSYWSVVLVGLLLIVVGRLFLALGGEVSVPFTGDRQPLGFELGTNVPLALATVVKMNAVSMLLISFAFILLIRLRDLVLFKRTRSSQRNWYVMLALMVVTSLSTFGHAAGTPYGPVAGIAMVAAIALMVLNAMRLSWIIFLNMKQKLVLAALSLMLVGTLFLIGITAGENVASLLGTGHAYLEHYSYALATFVSLSIIFGILYGVTSFLSLLFHLPTTTDVQQKVGEIAAMHSLTALVNQVFDVDRLLYMIAASPVEAGSAHRAWLTVTDRGSAIGHPRIAATVNASEEAVGDWIDVRALYDEVKESRELLLFDQAPTDHRVRVRPGDGIGSLLIVPLIARDELLGALFATKEVTFGFEKDDVNAMGVFAAQAALAMDHARLFEEQVEKERMARELDIARDVQRKLMPQHIPQRPGVSIAASSVPALEVGGDYFDFAEIDEHRIAFIVADVAGKGTSAAFYMAELQGIFRSVSLLAPTPTDFLVHANRALSPTLERHTFVSVVYGILDVAAETVTIARAGHCPPALINLHGKTRLLRTSGLGLGLDRTDRFGSVLAEEQLHLQPGDVLVLYTDGVVETRNRTGEEYGYEKLEQVLREYRHEEADELHESIVRDLQAFSGDGAYGDDMTLVVLKWQGVLQGQKERLLRTTGATVE